MSNVYFHRFIKVVITTSVADFTTYLCHDCPIKECIEMFKLSNGISDASIISTEVSYITNYLKSKNDGNN